MTTSSRVRLAVGVALGVALLALAGCGRFGGGAAGTNADTSDLSWDAQALQSIGFTTEEFGTAADATATPAPAASKGANHPLRHKLVRFAFGKRALHGEAVVQTDDGLKTVVVQRGTITAASATTITVKSTDGYTVTWTFGNPIHVVKDRAQVAPSTLTVGTTVGVAGAKDGTTTTARLVVIPPTK
jgi:hypothetical protein